MENRQYREPNFFFLFSAAIVVGTIMFLVWLAARIFWLLYGLFRILLYPAARLFRPLLREYKLWLETEWKLEMAYREVEADWQMLSRTGLWSTGGCCPPVSKRWPATLSFLIWVTRKLGRKPLIAREEERAGREVRQ